MTEPESRPVTESYAQEHLEDLLEEVVAGSRVVITREDVPVAALLSEADYLRLTGDTGDTGDED